MSISTACSRPNGGSRSQTTSDAQLDRPTQQTNSAEIPEGMGFLIPSDPSLPEAVRRAASSVLAIAVPGGNFVSAKEMFNNASLVEALRRIESTPLSEEFSSVERTIYSAQINKCIEQSLEDCHIFEGVSYGTAFVTGDGRDLRTALHVVRDFVRNARAQKANAEIPVYLLGSDGEIIYGPHNLQAQVGATLEGALDASVYEGPDFGKFNLDQVLIRLSVRVANPIPIASASLSDGEPGFIVSVPRRTDDRKTFGAVDSDGTSVRISKGTALGPKRLVERLAQAGFVGDEVTAAQSRLEGTALTADGAPRSSGGAILNQNGEVVGVYTSGLPQSGAVFPYRVSYGGNSLISVP